MNICVVGTGYVGLVSAACFAEMGNTVHCVDINPKVVEALRAGKVHIYEPGLEDLVLRNTSQERLLFTTSLVEGLRGAELAFICVGTPSLPDGSCDLRYVQAVAAEIGEHMSAPLVVVDKSTVPVGTAKMVQACIEKAQQVRGVTIPFEVVSNPEFLKEGDAVSDFMKPDRVIIGTHSESAARLMKTVYAPFARTRDKIIIMGPESAEMTKYAANCMLATKISFINEIAGICEKVGADVRDVRTGIGADQRIGYHFIYPGLGYGGSCFPKDVKALIHTARQVGFAPQLLEAVEDVNAHQKLVMARRIEDYFAPQGGIAGKTLAMWGIAFKANTDDMRESAALYTIDYLTERGMKVRCYDPEAATGARARYAQNPLVHVVEKQYEALEGANGLLVATEWNQFRTPDFSAIKNALQAPILFDGRNLYNPADIARLGFAYFCIGKGA